MPARFVNIDRDTPLLMPPDLRQWIPQDHLAHYILDAIENLPLTTLRVNERGTGDEQFPPRMMLGLLIYCYATGTFSSRAIERATHTDVAVRFLAGDTHPDHDTICTFRRQNAPVLAESFVQVLALAQELKLVKFGQLTLAVDGTKIGANASKHSAVSYRRAGQQIELLQQEVAQLLAKADQADSAPLQDGLTIPAEIARRRDRIQKLQAARATLEQRAAQKAAAAQAPDAAPTVPPPADPPASHGASASVAKRRSQTPPAPQPKDQYNFTDPDSRIMKAGNGAHFEQAYNAQAAVTTDSRLVVAARVTQAANDKQQLEPTLAAVPADLRKKVMAVLADNGFYSADAVEKIEAAAGPTVYAAVEKLRHHRTVADLEKRPDPPPPAAAADPQEHMRHRLRTTAGRALYRLRQQTVEPVFGIIKEAMGFRRFHLRGQAGVALEWTLVCVAYNLRRLHRLQLAAD
jgi:transposase